MIFVERKLTEGRHGEGEASHANLGGVPSTGERQAEDSGAGELVEATVGVGEACVGVGLVRLQSYKWLLVDYVMCYRVRGAWPSARRREESANCSFLLL